MAKEKVSVTVEQVVTTITPHLRSFAGVATNGKLAYAIGYNLDRALRIQENFDRARHELAFSEAELNEDGTLVQESDDQGQTQLKFSTPEKAEAFAAKIRDMFTKELHGMSIHKFDRELLQGLPSFAPIAMVALSPLFLDEEEQEEEIKETPQPDEHIDKERELLPLDQDEDQAEFIREPVAGDADGGLLSDPDI